MFGLAFIISLVTLVISVPIFLVFGLGSSLAAIAIAAKELPRPKTKKIGTEMTNVTREIIKANPNIYSFPKSFLKLSKISSNEVNAKIKNPTGKAKNIHQIGMLISNSIICPKL